MTENNDLQQSERLWKLCCILSMFFAGCTISMVVLVLAMEKYGDVSVSLNVIKSTAAYWCIPLAFSTFIGFLASRWGRS